MQTKRHSFAEACFGACIASVGVLLVQRLVYPFFGVHIPFLSGVKVMWVYLITTIVRQYVVRRWFDQLHADEPYDEVKEAMKELRK